MEQELIHSTYLSHLLRGIISLSPLCIESINNCPRLSIKLSDEMHVPLYVLWHMYLPLGVYYISPKSRIRNIYPFATPGRTMIGLQIVGIQESATP